MPIEPNTVDKIIAAAETRMREAGFHGFSFREIARDVGIKSASVHHHFPTKEDLATAVVEAYTERHMEKLGDATDPKQKPEDLLARYVDGFRRDLVDEHRMCLCGLLGSESSTLPPAVNRAVRTFFSRNVDWTQTVLARANPNASEAETKSKALFLASALEGALMVAHCLGETEPFEKVSQELAKVLPGATRHKK